MKHAWNFRKIIFNEKCGQILEKQDDFHEILEDFKEILKEVKFGKIYVKFWGTSRKILMKFMYKGCPISLCNFFDWTSNYRRVKNFTISP